MNYYLTIFFAPVFLYFINKYLRNKSFLLNFSGDKHQNFTLEKKIPLSGGIFLFTYFIIFFNQQIYLSTFVFAIFVLGLFSDLKIFNSAKFRFFLQIVILLLFIYLVDLTLQNTKVIIIDQILKYKMYNYLFVLFCILILINGTNFIDGLNTNVLGYYIIISFFIYHSNQEYFLLNFSNWYLWISILIILYLFNLFNQLFIGDSGAYLLGLIYGFILIETYINNLNLSPFYIVTLIWYPCFEILFSIIRKFRFNQSPILPDTKHLHQLLYLSLKKKFKLSNLKANILSASMINLYNFFIIFIASLNTNNSQNQIFIISLCIIVYCYTYFGLFKNIYIKKNLL
jgi:UDP-N-acetylmuramyl pentapeptide phosphotransferase/UDP-N-acetylglucosamine-1-phosphate transferase